MFEGAPRGTESAPILSKEFRFVSGLGREVLKTTLRRLPGLKQAYIAPRQQKFRVIRPAHTSCFDMKGHEGPSMRRVAAELSL